MLFYILAAAFVVFTLWHSIRTRSLEVLGLSTLLCAVALVLFIVSANTIIVGTAPHVEERYALGLKPSNNDGDFLGTGSKNGDEMVSYTYGAADHPDVHALVPQKHATISQDASVNSSQVVVSTYSGYNYFIQPFHFVFRGSVQYDFHVPLGSVSGNLVVDSKKPTKG